MPIPKNGNKAIWKGREYSTSGKWDHLVEGMKGISIAQTYDKKFTHCFYPFAYKGYCISCNETDFELITAKAKK